jgi:hypothetical protein
MWEEKCKVQTAKWGVHVRGCAMWLRLSTAQPGEAVDDDE